MKTKLLSIMVMTISYQAIAQQVMLSDKKATKETANLFKNLNSLQSKGYLVGHQDALAYGVGWKYIRGRSDVKDVTGDQPGLYGWEIGHIETDSSVNLDTVPFNKMKEYIRYAYKRGSVVTISWHGNNPLTGKSAWDPAAGSVAAVLPGGSKHDVFKAQLDKVAAFLTDLKGSNGEAIPVLFRPFHELTGNWFWWGTKSSTPDEYKQLFRFAVNYWRNQKNLHNLIIVYNTGGEFTNKDEFLQRYPGDDVVDVLSFDNYQDDINAGKKFSANISSHLSIIEEVAKERNKIPALGEVGFNNVPDATWWTQVLAPALNGHKIAYVLVWRNAGYKADTKSSEYYIPYKGQASAADFVKFYKLPETLFESDVRKFKLYK